MKKLHQWAIRLCFLLMAPWLFASLSPANATNYYKEFTPNLFAGDDSPMTVHAAYYNQNSGAVNWTILVTYKEGFIIKTTQEEYEKSTPPTKLKCSFSANRYSQSEIFSKDYIEMGHMSLSAPDMGHFVVKKFEDDNLKIFAGPTSAVFRLQCNRTGKEVIPKSIKRFFKKMKDGLVLICPEKSTLSDWTTDFDSLKPYLSKSENRDGLYLTTSSYIHYFKG